MQSFDPQSDLSLVVFAGTLGIVLLVGIVIFLVLIVQRRELRSRIRLERLKTEHQKRLTEMSFLGQENERIRIAGDIHDDIGSLLSAIKQQVNFLGMKTKNSNEITGLITETKDTISLTITEIRNIIEDLTPSILQSKGFSGAVRYMAEKVNHPPKLRVKCEISGKPVNMENNREVMLYRSIQEIIHNAIKHSKASRLDIKLHWAKDILFIELNDNGTGFDYHAVMNSDQSGLGLKNIASRVEIAGGSMEVDSSPDGTLYRISCAYERIININGS